MNCREVVDNLETWVDGELGPEKSAELEAHLRGCPECRREADKQRMLIHGLKLFFSHLERKDLYGPHPVIHPKGFSSWGEKLLHERTVMELLMNRNWLLPVIAVVILLIGFFFLKSPRIQEQTSLVTGVLRYTGYRDLLVAGSIVKEGVSLEAVSPAIIRHRLGSQGAFREGSVLQVDQDGFYLWKGFSGISKPDDARHFRVKTPHVVLGVRGTRFDVLVNASATAAFLYQGKIEAITGMETVTILPGELLLSTSSTWKKMPDMREKWISILDSSKKAGPISPFDAEECPYLIAPPNTATRAPPIPKSPPPEDGSSATQPTHFQTPNEESVVKTASESEKPVSPDNMIDLFLD